MASCVAFNCVSILPKIYSPRPVGDSTDSLINIFLISRAAPGLGAAGAIMRVTHHAILRINNKIKYLRDQGVGAGDQDFDVSTPSAGKRPGIPLRVGVARALQFRSGHRANLRAALSATRPAKGP